jgi:hypothetical protein
VCVVPAKRTDKSERKKQPPRDAKAILERNAKVIESRSKGRSWAGVCEDSGLSLGQVKRVWKKFVDEGKLEVQTEDPIAVVFEQITRYDVMIEELADLSKNSDNDSARVGAIRARAQVMREQIELLQAVGLVPKQLGSLKIELENRYVVQQLMVFVDKYVPGEKIEEAEGELLKLFRRAQTPQQLATVSE